MSERTEKLLFATGVLLLCYVWAMYLLAGFAAMTVAR